MNKTYVDTVDNWMIRWKPKPFERMTIFFEWIARAIQMDTKYAWEVTPGDWQNMFAMFINPYV